MNACASDEKKKKKKRKEKKNIHGSLISHCCILLHGLCTAAWMV